MSYTKEQCEHFCNSCREILEQLKELQLKIVVQGQPFEATSRLREHLLHGAARRVGVIRRSIQNIYTTFPPDTTRPLSPDALADVNINLHAFMINLYGLHDNWAWAYVLRHNLEEVIGGRRRIGLFIQATSCKLPTELRAYISSATIANWYKKYVMFFRDALAHRIPPYIPPALITHAEGDRFNELESEMVKCIKARQWQRVEEIWVEQAAIGVPCLSFLHAFTEDTPANPVMLHSQILCDAKAIVEFGELFLEHWHKEP